jgi:predicted small secreted protein
MEREGESEKVPTTRTDKDRIKDYILCESACVCVCVIQNIENISQIEVKSSPLLHMKRQYNRSERSVTADYIFHIKIKAKAKQNAYFTYSIDT